MFIQQIYNKHVKSVTISVLFSKKVVFKNFTKHLFLKPICSSGVNLKQRSKFASTVGKCREFCRGISPFYSICLDNKNAEAAKFLEIKKKK